MHKQGGKEEPKDHSSRTADFSCIFGSQNLKINHKTPPPYQQALWKGCTKKALTKSNQQIQASGVIGTMIGAGCYGQMRTRLNFLANYVHHQHVWHENRNTYKEKHLPPNNTHRQKWWWIIDASGLFCCQWSRVNGIMKSRDILTKNLIASARKLTRGVGGTRQ